VKNPVENIRAAPTESNILIWHYVLEGPKGSAYEGGWYHGIVTFPSDYPHKPPRLVPFVDWMVVVSTAAAAAAEVCSAVWGSNLLDVLWEWCLHSLRLALVLYRSLEITPVDGRFISALHSSAEFGCIAMDCVTCAALHFVDAAMQSLRWVALRSAALSCVALRCASLRFVALRCASLCFVALRCASLSCFVLCCVAMRFVA
jgi:hypothetical protein